VIVMSVEIIEPPGTKAPFTDRHVSIR